MTSNSLRPSAALRAELGELIASDARLGAPDVLGPVTDVARVVEEVDVGEGTYRLTRVPLPGRAGVLRVGGMPAYPRLRCERDVEAIWRFGVERVCCLVPESHAARRYGLPGYVAAARARFGESFLLLEVEDYAVPADDAAFERAVAWLDDALRAGRSVLVHCGAGCGRTGIVVAALMVTAGAEPLDAVRAFRARRGCGPETPEQVAYVVRFARRRQAAGDGR